MELLLQILVLLVRVEVEVPEVLGESEEQSEELGVSEVIME